MPECSVSSQNLIPCSLTFCSTIKFNPYLPFEFLIVYHSSFFAFYTYMLSIHNNLSAGAQNITGTKYRRLRNNYACLQVLVNNTLTWQSSCLIANNAQIILDKQ